MAVPMFTTSDCSVVMMFYRFIPEVAAAISNRKLLCRACGIKCQPFYSDVQC